MPAERRDLDARVIEAGAPSEVRERVGTEGVRCRAVVSVLAPDAFGERNGAGPDIFVERDLTVHLTEFVEDADGIFRGQTPWLCVRRVHMEHGRALTQLAERRRHGFFTGRGYQ